LHSIYPVKRAKAEDIWCVIGGLSGLFFLYPDYHEEYVLSKVSEKLSSMHITMWVLVFLSLWIGFGLYLSGEDSYTKEFRMMNDILIRDWLFSHQTGILQIWFVILCAAMTVMGINLIFCSWSKIFKIIRARFSSAVSYLCF
jgi:hypothetical protein